MDSEPARISIEKISITDYRSCARTEFFPCENLSVLIGPNGSGKTTVLSAIRLLYRLTGRVVSRARLQNSSTDFYPSDSELRITYKINGTSSIVYKGRLSIVTDKNNSDEIVRSEDSWYSYDLTKTKKYYKYSTQALSQIRRYSDSVQFYYDDVFSNAKLGNKGIPTALFEAMIAITDFNARISYYSASMFTNPTKSPISFEVSGEGIVRQGLKRTPHENFLFDLYATFKENRSLYEEFMQLVGKDGIGLIDGISFDEVPTSTSSVRVVTGGRITKKRVRNKLIVPLIKIGKNTISPNQLSEGSFKSIALIFYIISDTSSLLMIEEPEVCVHHGLLSSMIEIIGIYSRDKQILLSTHSETVLDKIELSNLFLVRNDRKKGTEVKNIEQQLGRSERNSVLEFLEQEGSLGEYLKHSDIADG